MNARVSAVVFDLGGVLTESPMTAFAAYEAEAGLPAGLIRRLNSTDPDSNAWARYERSELDVAGFTAAFEAEAAAVRSALGPALVRLDHIGSTAVQGLAAKPVIDVQISVASLDSLAAYRLPLEGLGYGWRADNPDRTKRYFREPLGEPRTHVHVRAAGSWGEQLALLFRDYLRATPEAAAAYAELKRRLAVEYRHDREGYVDAKGPFIWSLVARATEWSQAVGWEPGPSDA